MRHRSGASCPALADEFFMQLLLFSYIEDLGYFYWKEIYATIHKQTTK